MDRIALYEVRDWFGLNIFGSMAFCNFADFWIVLGAILAVIDLMFLNEYAVFPLTKTAKAAQQAKKEEEERKKAAQSADGAEAEVPVSEDTTNESDTKENGD